MLNGAAVRISIVGFDNGAETTRTLDGKTVEKINADLSSLSDVTKAVRLPENRRLGFIGDQPTGAFEVSEKTAREWFKTSINPNGRPNSDVVRPYANGSDITRRNRHDWIVDFGVDSTLEEASMYEAPFEHIRKTVYPVRQENRNETARQKWWLHWRPRPDMREALAKLERFICTPTLSKHRLFAWLEHPTLADHQLVAIASDSDYLFGVLHSRPHEVWALKMGTSLEDRPRYTPTTTLETFPFPWAPGREPKEDPRVEAIAVAARELGEKRERWLNPEGITDGDLTKRTLTNLYNERPTWLDLAHQKLDRTVFDAYGWPYEISDEEIVSRLLALNLERAGRQAGE